MQLDVRKAIYVLLPLEQAAVVGRLITNVWAIGAVRMQFYEIEQRHRSCIMMRTLRLRPDNSVNAPHALHL
ncbi:hypothetical protein WT33_21030 [Burkholderia stagnalis]|nr:hypothetical protein WT33_21030 [Burkholderia stagnalis]